MLCVLQISQVKYTLALVTLITPQSKARVFDCKKPNYPSILVKHIILVSFLFDLLTNKCLTNLASQY